MQNRAVSTKEVTCTFQSSTRLIFDIKSAFLLKVSLTPFRLLKLDTIRSPVLHPFTILFNEYYRSRELVCKIDRVYYKLYLAVLTGGGGKQEKS